jgi:hypothetical protein
MNEARRTASVPFPRRHSLDTRPSPRQRHLRPDPAAHARALIDSYGTQNALWIAHHNAKVIRPGGDYWSHVLATVEEQARKDQRRSGVARFERGH